MSQVRRCTMCGEVKPVTVNPVRRHIARCSECTTRAYSDLDRGVAPQDPFADDSAPPDHAASTDDGTPKNFLQDPEFHRMLTRGQAETMIKEGRRALFGKKYYYAVLYGRRVESDDREELYRWLVDNL